MKMSMIVLLLSVCCLFSTVHSEVPGLTEQTVKSYGAKAIIYGAIGTTCAIPFFIKLPAFDRDKMGGQDVAVFALNGTISAVMGSMAIVNVVRYSRGKKALKSVSVDLHANGAGLTCTF